MKISKTGITVAGIVAIIAVILSFFIGQSLKEQEYLAQREEHCKMLLSFAIDKAQNEDLADINVRKALISNVYAASEFCDNAYAAGLLHNLWNELIFVDDDNGKYIENADNLVSQLTDVVERIKHESG